MSLLAERQVRQLGEIATMGTNLALQIVRRVEAARWLDAPEALRFARVARAVRQTIAMERCLGAHDDAINDRQMAKLNALSEAADALMARVAWQNLDSDWAFANAMMTLRLTVSTERTMALHWRLDEESRLTDAAAAGGVAAAAAAAAQGQVEGGREGRRAGRAAGADAPGDAPGPGRVSEAAAVAVMTMITDAVTDFEGKPEGKPANGTEEADRLARDLAAPGIEDEIGGRSLAEIAKEACEVIGIEPAPELIADADGDGEAAGAPDRGGGAGGFPHLTRPLRPDGAERGRCCAGIAGRTATRAFRTAARTTAPVAARSAFGVSGLRRRGVARVSPLPGPPHEGEGESPPSFFFLPLHGGGWGGGAGSACGGGVRCADPPDTVHGRQLT